MTLLYKVLGYSQRTARLLFWTRRTVSEMARLTIKIATSSFASQFDLCLDGDVCWVTCGI